MQLNIAQKLHISFLIVIFFTSIISSLAYVTLSNVSNRLAEIDLEVKRLESANLLKKNPISIIQHVNKTKTTLIFLLLVGFIISIILSFFMSNRISDPIALLSKKAAELGKGEYGRPILIKSQDEIGRLSVAFNQMATSLKQREYDLKKANQELEKRDNILQEANKELKRLNDIKSDFLSITSHELRTPLTAIRGYVSLLYNERLGSLNEQQKNSLKVTEEKVTHLNNLINELLDLAKIEANKYNISVSKEDVTEIINTTIDSLEPLFAEKNIEVNNYLSHNFPNALVDKEKIIQVITNLLSNAIKFTPENGHIIIYGSKITQGKKKKCY
ncbi:MAG: HAMP domain-containing sensor histidine kinase [bacterium]